MIRTIEGTSYYKIITIDLVGIHPDQEAEDYFASQLGIAIQENKNWDGLYLRTITPIRDKWVIVFYAE